MKQAIKRAKKDVNEEADPPRCLALIGGAIRVCLYKSNKGPCLVATIGFKGEPIFWSNETMLRVCIVIHLRFSPFLYKPFGGHVSIKTVTNPSFCYAGGLTFKLPLPLGVSFGAYTRLQETRSNYFCSCLPIMCKKK